MISITSISPLPIYLKEWLIERWKKEMGMDKKMAAVTKKIKTADKVLRQAQKENVKLTKIDKEVRDPKIKKCDKMMMKAKKK